MAVVSWCFYSWPVQPCSLLLFLAWPSVWQSPTPSPSWFVSAPLHVLPPAAADAMKCQYMKNKKHLEKKTILLLFLYVGDSYLTELYGYELSLDYCLLNSICCWLSTELIVFIWPVWFGCIPYLSCQPASPPLSSAPWLAWSQHWYAWSPPADAVAPPSSSPGPGRRQPVTEETDPQCKCTAQVVAYPLEHVRDSMTVVICSVALSPHLEVFQVHFLLLLSYLLSLLLFHFLLHLLLLKMLLDLAVNLLHSTGILHKHNTHEITTLHWKGFAFTAHQ